MKKEEYREARREFGETAAGLGKEVRKEAREAYRNVRESADTRMKEIKEELRETEHMEKILGDGCSSHNKSITFCHSSIINMDFTNCKVSRTIVLHKIIRGDP